MLLRLDGSLVKEGNTSSNQWIVDAQRAVYGVRMLSRNQDLWKGFSHTVAVGSIQFNGFLLCSLELYCLANS